ncbi:unnamed protein product [Ceutorhynchus assimilis]|uniref:Protein quiver n=1 Tax=Ceutorhynchus assimilis TaxID=467358 RepID=A0A9N9MUQ3_9CUCU|nr:unnamed protein product [Ceutorhynchus assimilis]
MASFIPYFVALALAVNAAAALECYNCNSKESAACKWGFTSFTYNTEKCGSAGFLDSIVGAKCFKITAKNKKGEDYIARGCMNPPAVGCQVLAKTVGWISDQSSNDPDALSELDCQTCDSDKCNSASKISGFTLLGVLLAVFAFLF